MLSRLRDALRAGGVCLVVAVAAEAWELLARQVPSSPWHVAGFPAEVRALALRAWLVGLAVFALAPRAWERGLAREAGAARMVLACLYAGAALSLGALAYGAATGVFGVQLQDTGRAGRGLLALRLAGDALLLVALLLTARAAARETASASASIPASRAPEAEPPAPPPGSAG